MKRKNIKGINNMQEQFDRSAGVLMPVSSLRYTESELLGKKLMSL